MYRPKLKSVLLHVPEVIATEVLGGCCDPNLREGGRTGSAMVPFERTLVSSYIGPP